MSAQKHTPGPCSACRWHTDYPHDYHGKRYCLRCELETPEARERTRLGRERDDRERAERKAREARAAACVAACEGIADPGVVPEMLAALKTARIELGAFLAAGAGGPTKRTFEMVEAIIARAGNRA